MFSFFSKLRSAVATINKIAVFAIAVCKALLTFFSAVEAEMQDENFALGLTA